MEIVPELPFEFISKVFHILDHGIAEVKVFESDEENTLETSVKLNDSKSKFSILSGSSINLVVDHKQALELLKNGNQNTKLNSNFLFEKITYKINDNINVIVTKWKIYIKMSSMDFKELIEIANNKTLLKIQELCDKYKVYLSMK